MPSPTLHPRTLQARTLVRRLAVVVVAAALGAGCAGSSPEVPLGPDGEPDPVLAEGRDVFSGNCSGCHGSSGGGGTGPRLSGTVTETFPDPADQAEVIRNGRKQMPSFTGKLSEAQIDAVVRYTREVLG